MWDLIGAMLIGGVLMLVMNKAIEHGAREFINHNSDAITQAELATMTEIIQDNLRKVGYGISESYQASIIQTIEPDHFGYLTRINPNSPVADTVDFYIVPSDTFLFIDASLAFSSVIRVTKVFGEDPVTTHIGKITNTAVFRYLNQVGRETNIKQTVKMVEVTLVAVNPEIYLDNEVLSAATPGKRKLELKKLLRESYWRQTRVVSRNLRR